MSRLRAENYFTAALLILCGACFAYWFIAPLWASLFFSLILVVNYYGFYNKLKSKFSINKSAMITTLVSVVVIIFPLSIAIYFAASTIVDFASAVQNVESEEYRLLSLIIDKASHVFPSAELLLENGGSHTQGFDLQGHFTTVGQYGGKVLSVMYSSVISVTIWLMVIVFGVYYLLIFGERARDFFTNLVPVREEYLVTVFREFAEMTRTLTRVTLIIGLVQGSVGGLALWFVGADSWYMWTIVMIIFSMIPILGAGIVLAPTALVYGALGNTFAVVTLLLTFFLITQIDNYLKPKIICSQKEINGGLILLSTMAGTMQLGPIGFLAGPIVMAMILAVFETHMRERELFTEPDRKLNCGSVISGRAVA